MTRILSSLLFSLLILFSAMPVVLADITSDIDKLSAKSTKTKISSINRLVASGDPQAAVVLKAFLDGNLYTRKADKKVVIGNMVSEQFRIFDPLTNNEIGVVEKSSLKKARINNRLRKIIRGALGGLNLLSPEKSLRISAAKDVFKSQNMSVIALLEKAIAKETESDVMVAFQRSLAAVQATNSTDVIVRVDALNLLHQSSKKKILTNRARRNAKSGRPL
jgi:urea transport system permease protein